jgi:pimeloyl-ACP methyl ester carboxylesterase
MRAKPLRLPLVFALIFIAQPGAAPSAAGQAPVSDLVEQWRAEGRYFPWVSTVPENGGRTVQVFYSCRGDAQKPAVVMVHGFPTSSFDFRLPARDLSADHRVCMLDFPGYGLSDKPAGYRYTLADDAKLLWRFVTGIVPLEEFVLLSHDRGDSVALSFLQLYQAAATPPFRITHQFITNGNLYLPLANLTDFQKRMLDPSTSPAAVKAVTAGLLAAGLGQSQYTPPLPATDPEVRALAALFAHNDGVRVIPATIQYLNERKEFEVRFLETLRRSDIPATIMWGVHDTVAPVRVADYVFDTALKPRKVPGAYWLMPCGGHYLPYDQAAHLAKVVRLTLASQASGGKPLPAVPFNLSPEPCSPVLVAREDPETR